MDNPNSIVPLDGFCGNCGHFAGRHQELQCHMPKPEGQPPCPCTGMMWEDEMFVMDMNTGPKQMIAHEFIHLKAMYEPLLSQEGNIIVLKNYTTEPSTP